MGFSDNQIHDILELKEQLTEEIEKHLEEIEKLEKNISVLNTILKQTSFTKASDLTLNTEKKKDTVPIIKNSDGSTIANVFVSDDQLSIVLDKNISLNSETPPLKTFFIDRIIGEMKNKDNQEVEKGKIEKQEKISKDMKKRKKLLAKYKKAVSGFNSTLKNQEDEKLYNEIQKK